MIETKEEKKEAYISQFDPPRPSLELKDRNGQKYILKGCIKKSRFDTSARTVTQTPDLEAAKRIDRKGNEIKRDNRKKYKLTFADKVNK